MLTYSDLTDREWMNATGEPTPVFRDEPINESESWNLIDEPPAEGEWNHRVCVTFTLDRPEDQFVTVYTTGGMNSRGPMTSDREYMTREAAREHYRTLRALGYLNDDEAWEALQSQR